MSSPDGFFKLVLLSIVVIVIVQSLTMCEERRDTAKYAAISKCIEQHGEWVWWSDGYCRFPTPEKTP